MTATLAREPEGMVISSPQLDYLFFSWEVQLCTLVATCCYRRLNVIQRAVTHASLALFLRQTNTSLVLHALRAYVYLKDSEKTNVTSSKVMVILIISQ